MVPKCPFRLRNERFWGSKLCCYDLWSLVPLRAAGSFSFGPDRMMCSRRNSMISRRNFSGLEKSTWSRSFPCPTALNSPVVPAVPRPTVYLAFCWFYKPVKCGRIPPTPRLAPLTVARFWPYLGIMLSLCWLELPPRRCSRSNTAAGSSGFSTSGILCCSSSFWIFWTPFLFTYELMKFWLYPWWLNCAKVIGSSACTLLLKLFISWYCRWSPPAFLIGDWLISRIFCILRLFLLLSEFPRSWSLRFWLILRKLNLWKY